MKGPGMYERILVATDGSSYSDNAVDYAISLAKSSGAELIALHVATIDPSIGMIWEDVKDIVLGRQGEMLEGVKKKAEEKGVEARVMLETGIPSEKIIEVAEREDADIIIMGSHGHTKIGKIVIGSVTERVAGSANCPVTVIRTKK
jgi:nucleotide-binding universal stress UspA family protein